MMMSSVSISMQASN